MAAIVARVPGFASLLLRVLAMARGRQVQLDRREVIAAFHDPVPFALQRLGDAPLVPVDIGEGAQLAILANQRREVGHVHGNFVLDGNLVVERPVIERMVGLRCRPALVFLQRDPGEAHRIGNPHAAVAIGAPRDVEHPFVPGARVVHEHGVLAREGELDLAEHGLGPVRLDHVVVEDVGPGPVDPVPIHELAVLGTHFELPLVHQSAAAQQARPQLAHLDRIRHDPGRPEGDLLEIAGEDRRLLAGLARHDAHLAHHLAVLDNALREIGEVVPNVDAVQVGGHPAPFFHIGEQPLGLGAVLLVAAEERQIFLAQLLELRMRRVEPAKVGGRIVRRGDAGEDRFRFQKLRPAVEIGAELLGGIHDAPAARIASVFQDRLGNFDFIRGDSLQALRASHPRKCKGKSRASSPHSPARPISAKTALARACGCTLRVQPKRSVAARFVERQKRRALVALLVRFAGGESGKRLAHCLRLGRCRRLCNGVRRRLLRLARGFCGCGFRRGRCGTLWLRLARGFAVAVSGDAVPGAMALRLAAAARLRAWLSRLPAMP